MPLGGEPADVVARIEAYERWLKAGTGVPKLLLTFAPGPGTMMNEDTIDWCAANIADLETERFESVAGHHTPEDQPLLIATAISVWADRLGLRRG